MAELGRDAGSGHGAGKTLFCRLLRYCLGEDTFANDDLRRKIFDTLPAGLVGAEVVINSEPWCVLRPIGQTRKHIARKGSSLEELLNPKETGTGIEPLLAAIESQALPAGIDTYMPGDRAFKAWLMALAWMTRDQECRFDHILDWRHPRADSRSVALGLSKEQILIVVCSFLGMIEQNEIQLKEQRERISNQKPSLDRDLSYHTRRIGQLRTELAQSLQIPSNELVDGELALSLFETVAKKRLQDAEQSPGIEQFRNELASIRQQRDTTLQEIAVIKEELKRNEGVITLHQEQLKALRGERANLDAAEIKAKLGPVCPVCSVPIDQALAEGCGLSHVGPNPQKVLDEKERVVEQTKNCNSAITRGQQLISERNTHLRGLHETETKLQARIASIEKSIDEVIKQSRQKWFDAKRLVTGTSELGQMYGTVTGLKHSLETLDKQDKDLQEQQGSLRVRHRKTLERLNKNFSYVCRGMLGNQVKSSLKLSGQGLQADVEVGGMAMESLKAIAFDLTSLLMSMEGHAKLPAFFVHDSPREADLGESIYQRLFRLVAKLEKISQEPSFQYIITTTTKPPAELCRSTHLIVELQGSDINERLLRRDLS